MRQEDDHTSTVVSYQKDCTVMKVTMGGKGNHRHSGQFVT